MRGNDPHPNVNQIKMAKKRGTRSRHTHATHVSSGPHTSSTGLFAELLIIKAYRTAPIEIDEVEVESDGGHGCLDFEGLYWRDADRWLSPFSVSRSYQPKIC